MAADIVVERKELDKLFKDLAELSGKTAGKLLRERAGLLARICADRTQPVSEVGGGRITAESESVTGTGQDAKRMGEAAVTRDWARVYQSAAVAVKMMRARAGRKEASQLGHLLSAQDFEGADKLMRKHGIVGYRHGFMQWDDGERHRKLRNAGTGRVGSSVKPVFVVAADQLKAAWQKLKRMVGFTKAGMVTAAMGVPGAKGIGKIPQWIRRHAGRAAGSAVDATERKEEPYVLLNNQVRWASKQFKTAEETRAFDAFEQVLAKDLEKQIEAIKAKNRA